MSSLPARRPWALFLTHPGQQKSDEVFRLAAALSGSGLRVAGFAQRRADGGGCGYELVSLGRTEPSLAVGRRGRTPGPGDEAFCNCVFRPDAFITARGWLERDLAGADVAIIDELSRLESTGGGHVPAVSLALRQAPLTVLSVRADLLSTFMERFELGEPFAVIERGDPLGGFAAALCGLRRATPEPGARSLHP